MGRNPIAIGRKDNAVAQRTQPQCLNHGDHLFIDQYEIIVSIVQGEMPGAAVTGNPMDADDDPFALIESGCRAARRRDGRHGEGTGHSGSLG